MLAFLATWRLWIELGLLAALGATIGVQRIQIEDGKAARAADQVTFDQQKLRAADARAAEIEANRAEEQRRAAADQESINAKDQQLAQERADRVIADAASGRLQQRFAAALAAARRAAGNSTPPGSSTPAPAADLPTDMFRRVLEAAGQYRDAAESALESGELAEREYDSLKKDPS